MAPYQHTVLDHIRVQGTTNDDVLEFLGIPYASLKHQFAPPTLLDFPVDNSDSVVDATNYGPTVPGPDGCDSEFGLIQHRLPRADSQQSKTDGLRLNIIVPQATLSSPLPVLVFFHGGGLAVGSATWPQNHISKLISLSCEIGLPTVGVSVNYRVGAPGFLTSQELRDAGFTSNNGLRDQKIALKWVKKYISEFGGDPENITLLGHSAGGASATFQLADEEPLFTRLACLSGQFLAVKPLPSAIHEQFYTESIHILGLETLSPDERLARIRDLNSDDLAKISIFPSRPMVDHDVCHIIPSYESIKDGIPVSLHRGWCQDILIGDCQFDGTILAKALDCRKADIGDAFTTFLSRKLSKSPDVVSRILSSYHIDKDASDDNVLKNILRFANDVFFYAPTVCIARAWKSGAAYVYRFDQGNPWEGRWQGEAAHITDLTMLLQNYNDFLPDACRAIGRDYARDILVFASGRSPWSAYQKAEERPFVQNYGSLPEGRREFIWGLMKDIGADNLMALLEAFIVEG